MIFLQKLPSTLKTTLGKVLQRSRKFKKSGKSNVPRFYRIFHVSQIFHPAVKHEFFELLFPKISITL